MFAVAERGGCFRKGLAGCMGRLAGEVMAVLCVVFLLSEMAWAGGGGQRRIALIIGNATYAHAPALKNPINDAVAIGSLLQKLGFDHVAIAQDLGYQAMRRRLRAFARRARQADVALFYFAGHGLEIRGQNYLLPSDAILETDSDVQYEGVSLSQILTAVEGARKLRVVILDACRNNPFATRMKRTGGASRTLRRGLGDIEPAGNVLVAYAAKHGTVAEDGDGKNSPYAKALLAHMGTPGLDIQLMFRRVRDAVLAATKGRQRPFTYGSISGRITTLVPVAVTAHPKDGQAAMAEGAPPSRTEETPESVRMRLELAFWETAREAKTKAAYRAYLERYPRGHFAALARMALQRLTASAGEGAAKVGRAATKRAARSNELKSSGCKDWTCHCKHYGRLSVAQYKRSVAAKCNYGWPRWHDDYSAHYNWCKLFVGKRERLAYELNLRELDLKKCTGKL